MALVIAAAVGCSILWLVGCGEGTMQPGGAAPTSAMTIVTTILPAGVAGVTYGAAIQVANGTEPYSYAVTSGSLPPGLALMGSVVQGIPASAATSNFTVTVTDKNSMTATASYTVPIAAAPAPTLTLSAVTLPGTVLNSGYSTTLSVHGGLAPYTFTQTGGSLPAGLNLSSSGVVAGTPTASGTFSFGVHVVDSSATPGSLNATLTLSIADAAVSVDTTNVLAKVPQTFFGMHTSVYDPELNDVSHLPGLLAVTGITTLRYPGGGFSDNYHWAQHTITPSYMSAPPACGIAPNGYLAVQADFGSFLKTLMATGTQALITVNYGTSVSNAQASRTIGSDGQNTCSEPNTQGQPQEAAAWVAYANGSATNTQVIGPDAAGFDWKTVGYWAGLRGASPLAVDDGYNFLRIGHVAPVGIKFWEVGNEVYYNGWSNNLNPEDDLHSPYIYPNGYTPGGFLSRNQLAALSPTAYGTNAMQWVQAMKAVDPTILVGIDFAAPGATDPIPLNWNPDLAQSACASGMFDLAIIHYYPGTWKAVQASELLSLPQSDIPRVVAGIQANLEQYCPANASAIKFFVSETGPNAALASGFPTQALGLFAINDYLSGLQSGVQNIDWLELHNGTYLDPTETPGPAYYGIEMVHQLAGVGDSLVSATSSSGSVLSWGSLKANGQKGILLINADPANAKLVLVSVSGAALGSSGTAYSFGVSTVQSAGVLAGTVLPVDRGSFLVTVPAYTAVEVMVQ
jgi:hypothetical protein